MIDQINELPEDVLKSSSETSRYTENKWISRKNQNKLYFLRQMDQHEIGFDNQTSFFNNTSLFCVK